MATTFKTWLIAEERRVVDPAIQAQYEHEFLRQLDALLNRTRSPELRETLTDMKTCPIKDSTGRCYSFVGWIVNSLMRPGCAQRIDVEAALNYIAFRLLSPVGERGNPRSMVFDFDEDRPWMPGTNPVSGRLKTFVLRDIQTVCGKKPSQTFKNMARPPGTMSIGHRGRKDDADSMGTVSPDEIPAARSTHESELVADVITLLKKRATPTLPLVAVFQAILNGAGLRDQRARFGHKAADAARRVSKDTVRQYAADSQNQQLLGLMDKRPAVKRPKVKKPKPVVHPDPEIRDRLSLIDTLDKAGGEGSMALFGRKRRKWLNYAPRDPNSPHRNRLIDVLTRMTDEGLLVKRGTKYMAGPNYVAFRTKHGVPAHESVLATAI